MNALQGLFHMLLCCILIQQCFDYAIQQNLVHILIPKQDDLSSRSKIWLFLQLIRMLQTNDQSVLLLRIFRYWHEMKLNHHHAIQVRIMHQHNDDYQQLVYHHHSINTSNDPILSDGMRIIISRILFFSKHTQQLRVQMQC